MKVLIVDDDFNNRELLRLLLEPYGQCHMARNGADAVEAFQEALTSDEPFDLVLLDIMMPIMDGQEALKKIRYAEKRSMGQTLHQETRDYTTIFMVTSLDDPAHMVQSYAQGRCHGYITKPVETREFYDRLKKHNLIPQDA